MLTNEVIYQWYLRANLHLKDIAKISILYLAVEGF